ncbi:winged helix-turn-helix domain-containing protein [Brevibacillus borstelensis]|uniref:winged helix-turn-helix domain-containing protein n=1 Tax=Brevibacillus borstelensis TaxID=45462 RepID=UPI0030C4E436
METLHFFDDAYEVCWNSERIALLPKEYALLRFLYTRRNQVFRRTDLLDLVWGRDEAPTDRTVDDHVYRLRKKLRRWKHLLAIETVRGIGYKLTWKEPKRQNLLENNPELREHVRHMLEMYHGLGMGAAMQTLSANKDVLGIELDPFYAVYLRFVTGDFRWFLTTPDLPFSEKLFYLAHLYFITEDEPVKILDLFKRILDGKERLPGLWEAELEINMISLLVEAKRWQQAEGQLQKVAEIVAGIQSPSYTLTYLFQRVCYLLDRQDVAEAEIAMKEAKAWLAEKPMQREQGMLVVFEAMWQYLQGQREAGRLSMDKGVEILQQTRFVPHYLFAIRKIDRFFQTFPLDSAWQQKYQKEWERVCAEYQFPALKRQLLDVFARHL